MIVDWNFIILAGGSVAVAGVSGIVFAFASHKLKEYMLGKRVVSVLKGKSENVFNLDGERINVNKFRWKDYDGEMKYFEVLPEEKIQGNIKPEAIIEPEKPQPKKFKQLSDYR